MLTAKTIKLLEEILNDTTVVCSCFAKGWCQQKPQAGLREGVEVLNRQKALRYISQKMSNFSFKLEGNWLKYG